MRELKRIHVLGLAIAILAFTGCSSEDSPTSSGDSSNTVRGIKADPSFANDIQEIFDRRGCSVGSCHGSFQSAELDLRAASSRGNLVNVSAYQTTAIRVIEGDAQNSYLVIKLEGRQTVGARMPSGASPLDNIDLTNIRNWIDQGAKDN